MYRLAVLLWLIPQTATAVYATTYNGGSTNHGSVFEYVGSRFTTIYSFCPPASDCQDGEYPAGALVVKSGAIYGTTTLGGSNKSGVLFRLSKVNGKWTERVLHNFCSWYHCRDGGRPDGTLNILSGGRMVGTTVTGGDFSYGTLWKYSPDVKTMNVLYDFPAPP